MEKAWEKGAQLILTPICSEKQVDMASFIAQTPIATVADDADSGSAEESDSDYIIIAHPDSKIESVDHQSQKEQESKCNEDILLPAVAQLYLDKQDQAVQELLLLNC